MLSEGLLSDTFLPAIIYHATIPLQEFSLTEGAEQRGLQPLPPI
jgi:hypothetical protein